MQVIASLILPLITVAASTLNNAARSQIKATRNLLGQALDVLQPSVEESPSFFMQQSQFKPFVSFVSWALEDSKVFESENASILAQRMTNLKSRLVHSRDIVPSVISNAAVEKLFQVLTENKNCYAVNFDANHLKLLGMVALDFLNWLTTRKNRFIRAAIFDLAYNQIYKDRSKTANSFANFLTLFMSRTGAAVSVSAADLEEERTKYALLAIRRFNHHVLPVSSDFNSAEYFFLLLSEFCSALAKPEGLDSFIETAGADVLRKYPQLEGSDMAFLASMAKKVFLGEDRVRKLVRFYCSAVIKAYSTSPQKGSDLFAFGTYYTAKSLFISKGEDKLSQGFLDRMIEVLVPKDYHLSNTMSKLLGSMIEIIRKKNFSVKIIGSVYFRLRRFLGFDDQSDFNDSLMTQLVALKTAELDLEEIQEIYYDCPVNEKLRRFFGTESDDEGFDFPEFIHTEYKKAAKFLSKEDYKNERTEVGSFLGNFFRFGRNVMGGVTQLIASRQDYLTEASVMISLSRYGLFFHDSKAFAQDASEVDPTLITDTTHAPVRPSILMNGSLENSAGSPSQGSQDESAYSYSTDKSLDKGRRLNNISTSLLDLGAL